MNETSLLIVRHPETEANINGRFVGQAESPYTAEGRRQARRLPLQARALRAGHRVVVAAGPRARRRRANRAHRRRPAAGRSTPASSSTSAQAHGLTWEEINEAGIAFNYRSAERARRAGRRVPRGARARGRGVRRRDAHSTGGRHRGGRARGSDARGARSPARPERRRAVDVPHPQRADGQSARARRARAA